MNILPVGNGILFKSRLKKLYKQGKIKVEYDIYGNKLTKKMLQTNILNADAMAVQAIYRT